MYHFLKPFFLFICFTNPLRYSKERLLKMWNGKTYLVPQTERIDKKQKQKTISLY